ncbi:hypothetical protein N2152v2_002983 [Parachlorella kessleri]
MDELRRRELGLLLAVDARLTHRPQAFRNAALGNSSLVSRLHLTEQLPASGTLFATAWSDDGSQLLGAGEDCRLRVWAGDGSDLLQTLDTIRHINLNRGAARPYVLHKGRVRSLVPLDSYLVLSGSEDGTVREVDVRVKPPPLNRTQELQAAAEDYNVLGKPSWPVFMVALGTEVFAVDQRAERIGRARAKVGINSIAVDEHRPWLILTGGSDPLLRLYDRRMLGQPSDSHSSRSKGPHWVSCYIPAHLKADLWDSRPTATPLASAGAAAAAAGAAGQGYQLTSVAFARGGAEVVGSYSGHCIYAFDSVEHARDVDSLLHTSDSVLRVPTRPRSQVRRSGHQWAAMQLAPARSAERPQPQQQLQEPPVPTPHHNESQAGSMQQEATTSGPLSFGGRQQQQARHRAGAQRQGSGGATTQGTGRAGHRTARHRAIGVSASLRHLEHLRRQHSQIGGPGAGRSVGGGDHAESSRPANWQQLPSSSTLRSPPLHGQRYAGPAGGGTTAATGGAGAHSPPQGGAGGAHGIASHQRPYQQQGGDMSGSEASGDGSPAGVDRRGQGGADSATGGTRVRRSRRLWQRRRTAVHTSTGAALGTGTVAGSIAEEAALEEQATAMELDVPGEAVVGEAPPLLPQPAVSGNAEQSLEGSESDAGEEVGSPGAANNVPPMLQSPSRRRASRRLAAAAAAAAAGEVQGHTAGEGGRDAELLTTHFAGIADGIAGPDGDHPGSATGAAGGGDFKYPGPAGPAAAGRLPPRQTRHGLRQQHATHHAAADVAEAGLVDSTLGVMFHHNPATQLDSSEVAAAPPPAQGAVHEVLAHQAQQAQQEVTVEMQQPTLGSAGGWRDGRTSPMAAAEVTSRPVLSASVMGAVAPRRTGGGHEVSSLNSGGDAGLERVDSVAQRPLVDAPSVGNAPRAATTLATTAQRREAPEASTGHIGGTATQGARQSLPQQHPWQQQHQQQPGTGPSHQELQQPHAPLAASQQGPTVRHNQRHWATGAVTLAGAATGRHHPMPTASTGTSPAAALAAAGAHQGAGGAASPPVPPSGRGSQRARRHLGLADHSAAAGNDASQVAGLPQGEPATAAAAAAAAPAGAAGAASGVAPQPAFHAPPLHSHYLRRQPHAQQQQEVEAHTAALPRSEAATGVQHAQHQRPLAEHAQQEEPQQAQQAASLLVPQPTMLSGRGPSTVGNFMPGAQQEGSQAEVALPAAAESDGVHERMRRIALPGQGSGARVDQAPTQQAQQQQQQQGPPDSAVGAILHVADTEGEEVTEPTMYRCCYWGHANLVGTLDGNGVPAMPNMAFLGSRSDFLLAPSDDGSVFVWDYGSGGLLAVLESGSQDALACVAAHPHAPMLASCGHSAVVQLWSPEAEERCNMGRAVQLVERNARAILAADLQPPPQPPPGLNMLGGNARGPYAYPGEDGRQMRCNMM